MYKTSQFQTTFFVPIRACNVSSIQLSGHEQWTEREISKGLPTTTRPLVNITHRASQLIYAYFFMVSLKLLHYLSTRNEHFFCTRSTRTTYQEKIDDNRRRSLAAIGSLRTTWHCTALLTKAQMEAQGVRRTNAATQPSSHWEPRLLGFSSRCKSPSTKHFVSATRQGYSKTLPLESLVASIAQEYGPYNYEHPWMKTPGGSWLIGMYCKHSAKAQWENCFAPAWAVRNKMGHYLWKLK